MGKLRRHAGSSQAMSVTQKRASKKLGEYERKRNFDATPEPDGSRRSKAARSAPRFVIHEHHATRLHWDLRLEHDGALASWAVPNGIPEDPKHNRKAVHVEDHPLSYIDFQGTIPEGSYGAGEVTVWDHGTYELREVGAREDRLRLPRRAAERALCAVSRRANREGLDDPSDGRCGGSQCRGDAGLHQADAREAVNASGR